MDSKFHKRQEEKKIELDETSSSESEGEEVLEISGSGEEKSSTLELVDESTTRRPHRRKESAAIVTEPKQIALDLPEITLEAAETLTASKLGQPNQPSREYKETEPLTTEESHQQSTGQQHGTNSARNQVRTAILRVAEAATASVVAAVAMDEPNTFPAIAAAAMTASSKFANIAAGAAKAKSLSDSSVAKAAPTTAGAAAALASAEIYRKISQEIIAAQAGALTKAASLLQGPSTPESNAIATAVAYEQSLLHGNTEVATAVAAAAAATATAGMHRSSTAATASMNRPYTIDDNAAAVPVVQPSSSRINGWTTNHNSTSKTALGSMYGPCTRTLHGNAAAATVAPLQEHQPSSNHTTTGTGSMNGSHALHVNAAVTYDPRISHDNTTAPVAAGINGLCTGSINGLRTFSNNTSTMFRPIAIQGYVPATMQVIYLQNTAQENTEISDRSNL